MREITIDFLREETTRLWGLITGTRMLHPLGPRLHGTGEAITLAHVKSMADLRVTRVVLLEPGEDEQASQQILRVARMERSALREGDILAEGMPDVEPPLAAGRVLRPEDVHRLSGAGSVAIQDRGWEVAEQMVSRYLASHPPPERNAMATDTRVTRMTSVNTVRVRPLLSPRGRVLVVAGEDLLRSILSSMLSTAGHEVTEASSVAEAVAVARKSRFDVVAADGVPAGEVAALLRRLEHMARTIFLACVENPRSPEAAKLLLAGMNDVLPKPPRREVLLEKVRAGMECLGREVRLAPAVKGERRKAVRERGKAECSLRDALEGVPAPVASASVLDTSPLGFRVEYPVPDRGRPCPYTTHAVHPSHALYKYSRSNPSGRDLTMVIPIATGGAKEVFARVIWIKWSGLMEQAGLAFSRRRDSVYLETSSRPAAGR